MKNGYTMTEILAVMAIIAVLCGLLFPAVQYAREGARQTQCKSQLRGMAAAFHQHEDNQRHLPTGGWGWRWHGDPDRGFAQKQPGGWGYSVLPFIEQASIRNFGSNAVDPEKREAGRRAVESTIPGITCPSKRRSITYPYAFTLEYANIERPERVARTDYAANLGDEQIDFFGPGPLSLEEGDSGGFQWSGTQSSGIVSRRSRVRFADVTDGLSNVYLIGEKALRVAHYTDGLSGNDNQHFCVGFDRDTIRSGHYSPERDTNVRLNERAFGSAHPRGLSMALCDGSIAFVPFSVSIDVHRMRANRHDGGTLSGQE